MSKNCVPQNGKIYKSNGTIEGKEYLWPTQGNQVYQSSLHGQVQYQVNGSLACKDYLFKPDPELVAALKQIPRFEIGAQTENEESPSTKTRVLQTFVIPVDNKAEALACLDGVKAQNDVLRTRISEADVLPIYDKTGERITFDENRALKLKVSSYNQKLKEAIAGRLIAAGIDRSSPEWVMNMGKALGGQRLQLAAFSLRITLRLRHYIYEEFSISNLKEKPESYDYHVGARRRYSNYREFTVDIPLVSVEDLKSAIEIVDEWIAELPKALSSSTNGKDILLLTSKEKMSKEQAKLDKEMSAQFDELVTSSDRNNRNEEDDRADIDDILSLLDPDDDEDEEDDGDTD